MNKVSLAAVMICLALSSSLPAESIVNVSIPENIPGLSGQIATAPVEIDNAEGVQGFNLVITYDTSLLDLSDADIRIGSLTSGWSLVPFVDDANGTATIGAFGTAPLEVVSGSLLQLDFHVIGTSGTSILTPSGYLNETIFPSFASGSIDIVPEPATVASLLALLAAAAIAFKRRG